MKRLWRFLFLLPLCLLLGGTATASADYRVVVASDPHYIAPTLTDGGAYYQRVLQNGTANSCPTARRSSLPLSTR